MLWQGNFNCIPFVEAVARGARLGLALECPEALLSSLALSLSARMQLRLNFHCISFVEAVARVARLGLMLERRRRRRFVALCTKVEGFSARQETHSI